MLDVQNIIALPRIKILFSFHQKPGAAISRRGTPLCSIFIALTRLEKLKMLEVLH